MQHAFTHRFDAFLVSIWIQSMYRMRRNRATTPRTFNDIHRSETVSWQEGAVEWSARVCSVLTLQGDAMDAASEELHDFELRGSEVESTRRAVQRERMQSESHCGTETTVFLNPGFGTIRDTTMPLRIRIDINHIQCAGVLFLRYIVLPARAASTQKSSERRF
jgi:hypothetical protein